MIYLSVQKLKPTTFGSSPFLVVTNVIRRVDKTCPRRNLLVPEKHHQRFSLYELTSHTMHPGTKPTRIQQI